jgi:hypothetical protein
MWRSSDHSSRKTKDTIEDHTSHARNPRHQVEQALPRRHEEMEANRLCSASSQFSSGPLARNIIEDHTKTSGSSTREISQAMKLCRRIPEKIFHHRNTSVVLRDHHQRKGCAKAVSPEGFSVHRITLVVTGQRAPEKGAQWLVEPTACFPTTRWRFSHQKSLVGSSKFSVPLQNVQIASNSYISWVFLYISS